MERQYQPNRFFWQVPNRLLEQYLTRRRALADVNFGQLGETQVEPIYEAWLRLPEDVRNDIEQDIAPEILTWEGGCLPIPPNYIVCDPAQRFRRLT